jgi:cytochrome bd-type quinol oxidase subunit 2
MTKRSVVAVILLTLFTLGIYGLVWHIKTKNEMNSTGAQIPSGWLLILGIVVFPLAIYWMWKFAGGVEHVTRGKQSQAMAFVLLFLLGIIGVAIIQAELNKAIDQGMPGQLPQARVA